MMLRRLAPRHALAAMPIGSLMVSRRQSAQATTAPHADAHATHDDNRHHMRDTHVVARAPHRTVGGVFLVRCEDHPFKHSWEVNKMLRELRLEFRGQVSIHPDIPDVRKRLWRTRHVVVVERLDLDEAKALVGIPTHIDFSDLLKQLPPTFGRTKATQNPALRSKLNFMQYRRMRIRDIMHRDAVEKELLAAKKRAAAKHASVAA